eukprot:TRINITY_DN9176_c0_g1_i1.p1 TRINITY_DN9176_c0_g1~~TRINITY_DN9176_c0_g1_i1.p1  ORF type:complete len:1378 (+),score=368.75 TRINITY_DN9176_c0_g1_i1:59-4192(+)
METIKNPTVERLTAENEDLRKQAATVESFKAEAAGLRRKNEALQQQYNDVAEKASRAEGYKAENEMLTIRVKRQTETISANNEKIEQLTAALARAEEDTRSAKAALSAKESSATTEVTQLLGRLGAQQALAQKKLQEATAALQKQLADAEKANRELQTQLSTIQERSDMEKASMRTSHERAMLTLQQDHEHTLRQLRNDHDKALASVSTTHSTRQQQQDGDVSAKLRQSESERAQLIAKYEGAKRDTVEAHEIFVKQVRAQCQSQISTLEQQVASLQTALQRALAGLDSEAESVRQSHSVVLQQVQTKHASELSALQDRLATQAREQAAQLAQQSADYTAQARQQQQQYQTKLDDMTTQHKYTVDGLQLQLQQQAADIMKLQEQLDRETGKLSHQLNMQRAAAEDSLHLTRSRLTTVVEDSRLQHELELADLKGHHARVLDSVQAQLDAQREEHQKEMRTQSQRWQQDTRKQLEHAKENYEQQLASIEAAHSIARAQFDLSEQTLKQQLATLQKQIADDKEAQSETLEFIVDTRRRSSLGQAVTFADATSARSVRSGFQANFSDQVVRMAEEHRVQVERMRDEHTQAMQMLQERLESDMARHEAEFRVIETKLDAHITLLEQDKLSMQEQHEDIVLQQTAEYEIALKNMQALHGDALQSATAREADLQAELSVSKREGQVWKQASQQLAAQLERAEADLQALKARLAEKEQEFAKVSQEIDIARETRIKLAEFENERQVMRSLVKIWQLNGGVEMLSRVATGTSSSPSQQAHLQMQSPIQSQVSSQYQHQRQPQQQPEFRNSPRMTTPMSARSFYEDADGVNISNGAPSGLVGDTAGVSPSSQRANRPQPRTPSASVPRLALPVLTSTGPTAASGLDAAHAESPQSVSSKSKPFVPRLNLSAATVQSMQQQPSLPFQQPQPSPSSASVISTASSVASLASTPSSRPSAIPQRPVSLNFASLDRTSNAPLAPRSMTANITPVVSVRKLAEPVPVTSNTYLDLYLNPTMLQWAKAKGYSEFLGAVAALQPIALESARVSQAPSRSQLSTDTGASRPLRKSRDVNWLLLPSNVWVCVTSYLPVSSVIALSETCHALLDVTRDEALWQGFCELCRFERTTDTVLYRHCFQECFRFALSVGGVWFWNSRLREQLCVNLVLDDGFVTVMAETINLDTNTIRTLENPCFRCRGKGQIAFHCDLVSTNKLQAASFKSQWAFETCIFQPSKQPCCMRFANYEILLAHEHGAVEQQCLTRDELFARHMINARKWTLRNGYASAQRNDHALAGFSANTDDVMSAADINEIYSDLLQTPRSYVSELNTGPGSALMTPRSQRSGFVPLTPRSQSGMTPRSQQQRVELTPRSVASMAALTPRSIAGLLSNI